MGSRVRSDSVEVNIWDFLRFSGTIFLIAGILEACILIFCPYSENLKYFLCDPAKKRILWTPEKRKSHDATSWMLILNQ